MLRRVGAWLERAAPARCAACEERYKPAAPSAKCANCGTLPYVAQRCRWYFCGSPHCNVPGRGAASATSTPASPHRSSSSQAAAGVAVPAPPLKPGHLDLSSVGALNSAVADRHTCRSCRAPHSATSPFFLLAWQCPSCLSCRNFVPDDFARRPLSQVATCRRCATVLPSAHLLGWDCPICWQRNPRHVGHCAMCVHPRPPLRARRFPASVGLGTVALLTTRGIPKKPAPQDGHDARRRAASAPRDGSGEVDGGEAGMDVASLSAEQRSALLAAAADWDVEPRRPVVAEELPGADAAASPFPSDPVTARRFSRWARPEDDAGAAAGWGIASPDAAGSEQGTLGVSSAPEASWRCALCGTDADGDALDCPSCGVSRGVSFPDG